MVDYPGSLKSFTTKEDDKDVYQASHINDLQDEVEAIQAELGTDPAGSATDVKTRLAVMIADDGTVKSGTSFPGTTYANMLFVRTDLDTLYRRDASDSSWIAMAAVADYTASGGTTYVEASADTERSTISLTYVKLKEFTPLLRSGVIDISFQGRHDDIGGSYTASYQVYIDGVAVSGKTTSTQNYTYTTLSIADITVAAGETVQIYGKTNNTSADCYIKEVDIKVDNPTVAKEIT